MLFIGFLAACYTWATTYSRDKAIRNKISELRTRGKEIVKQIQDKTEKKLDTKELQAALSRINANILQLEESLHVSNY